MKEYTAKRCCGMPQWSEIPCAEISFSLLESDANISARAQLCYDNESLYIRLSAQEEHIRAELTGQYDEVCEDSCLEFFFCPTVDEKRYINIECNPNGALFLGIGTSVDTLVRLLPEDFPIVPSAKRIPGGWETVYTIPYTLIRKFFPAFSPTFGDAMQANFYKCGDKTVVPHYLCWNPVPTDPLTFHNPDAFGLVHFE